MGRGADLQLQKKFSSFVGQNFNGEEHHSKVKLTWTTCFSHAAVAAALECISYLLSESSSHGQPDTIGEVSS
jgi:hypothetical protein